MSMRNSFYLALTMLSLCARVSPAAETPIERVRRQFVEYSLHESTDRGARLLDDSELPKSSPDRALELLTLLRDDGSFSDLDYASQARSSWPAATHLTRFLSIVVSARRPDTPAPDRDRLIAATHRALAYWIQHDYQCPNWWYNQIGVPKLLGNIALLLGDDLTTAEREYIVQTALPRAKVGAMTGQNRVWLAANGVMRAALANDQTVLRQAADVIAEELKVGGGEGIQSDWSFHQHGAQQQFGNYGMAYAVELSRWATVLRDTPYAITGDKLDILRRYLLEGVNWVSWAGQLDISACGRQIFPGSPASKAESFAGVMRTMALADPHHADAYAAFVTRNRSQAASTTTQPSINPLVGNRYFWNSDYLVHRRPNLMTTLKMSSTRVIGGETVNKENLSGLLLADGATFFYRSGREYEDIFPVWNWRMIPGVTSEQGEQPLTWPAKSPAGETQFVGGTSDGQDGCAAMHFRRGTLRARKSWFFFGDYTVCLGADIRSTGKSPVVTTINQSLLKTPVTVRRANKDEEVTGDNVDISKASWIEHDGFRYRPLQTQSLALSAGRRTGNWKSVFDTPATPKSDITLNVFTLSINHGHQPTGGTYAYVVGPAGSEQGNAIRVFANDANVQAVAAGPVIGDQFAAVFWSAGKIDEGNVHVEVDQPCIILMNKDKLWVSDPTQKLRTLRYKLNDRDWTVVELPQGEDSGRSVETKRP